MKTRLKNLKDEIITKINSHFIDETKTQVKGDMNSIIDAMDLLYFAEDRLRSGESIYSIAKDFIRVKKFKEAIKQNS